MAQKKKLVQHTLGGLLSRPSAKRWAADPDHSVDVRDSSAFVEIVTATNHGAESDVHNGHDLKDVYELMENASSQEERETVVWELIKSRRPKENIQIPAQPYKDKRKKSGVTYRCCNREWFETYDFLAFHEKSKGVYCLACVLFPTSPFKQAKRALKLIYKSYSDWKDANEDFLAHSKLQYHLDSEAKMFSFLQTMLNPSTRIDLSMSEGSQSRVEKNRLFLKSIIKCLEFAGREGMALRGHRDDSTSEDKDHMGKFHALVNFRKEAGDVVLQEHLRTCPKNATYVSKTSQNQLLECMSEYIISRISEEVRGSTFYGVMADEVTDVSDWEQLGVALRYVKDCQIVERLVTFVACSSVTGKDICREIMSTLRKIGLDPKLCRAQTYDGAGAMSGHMNGCQAKFREEVPRALYYHCSSHQLNLVLSKASVVAGIQSMISDMKALGIFFQYSPKRQRQLESSIEKVNIARTAAGKTLIPPLKMKVLCETRWVERHTTMSDLNVLYEAVVHCLEAISTSSDGHWNSKTVTDANGLLRAITSDTFMVCFQTNHFLFGYTKGVSKSLQGSCKDMLSALEDLEDVRDELTEIRRTAEEVFKKVYHSVCQMGDIVGKVPGMPRVCSRQIHRCNVQAESPEVYWRTTVFIPFLDGVLTQLHSRFSVRSKEVFQGFALLPAVTGALNEETTKLIYNAFGEDLPSKDSFFQEVNLWKRKWSKVAKENLPKNLSSVLPILKEREKSYPNIWTIMRQLAIIAVTTASVERGNSALKFVKTELRNTMGQERLNALILLYVHKDISIDYNAVIDIFATKHPRKMLFVNPLDND